MSRPSWEETIFDICEILANRATCPRLHTACLAVNDDHQILGVGYNGAPRGQDHCEDVGCLMEGGHCRRSVHAEENLVAYAARNGVRLEGATVYILHRPCNKCRHLLNQVGIREIIWRDEYVSNG